MTHQELPNIQTAAEVVRRKRQQQQHVELHQLSKLQDTQAQDSDGSTPTLCGAQVKCLAMAIEHLRTVESSLKFQARLATQVELESSEGDYSDDNFAYGSTPFTSWLKVMCDERVLPAVKSAMCSPASGHKYMVWGSSLGWMVFYAALTFGWPCVGYELLPCLHEEALALAERLGQEGSPEARRAAAGMSFVCADMLSSSLEDVGVLLLANQCWDDDLMQQAALKIKAELPSGSLVIDYCGDLVRRLDRMQRAHDRQQQQQQMPTIDSMHPGTVAQQHSSTGPQQDGTEAVSRYQPGPQGPVAGFAVRLLAHVAVPVSWNEDQKIWVHVKV